MNSLKNIQEIFIYFIFFWKSRWINLRAWVSERGRRHFPERDVVKIFCVGSLFLSNTFGLEYTSNKMTWTIMFVCLLEFFLLHLFMLSLRLFVFYQCFVLVFFVTFFLHYHIHVCDKQCHRYMLGSHWLSAEGTKPDVKQARRVNRLLVNENFKTTRITKASNTNL